LQWYRVDMALSQETLRKMAGVSRETVRRGEAGKEIRLSSVNKLAKALKVKPSALRQPPPA
jgi:DNA-binding XRE family transcriptional regulator